MNWFHNYTLLLLWQQSHTLQGMRALISNLSEIYCESSFDVWENTLKTSFLDGPHFCFPFANLITKFLNLFFTVFKLFCCFSKFCSIHAFLVARWSTFPTRLHFPCLNLTFSCWSLNVPNSHIINLELLCQILPKFPFCFQKVHPLFATVNSF